MAILSLKIGLVLFAVLSFGQGKTVSVSGKKGGITVQNIYNIGIQNKTVMETLERIEKTLATVQKQVQALQPGGKLNCTKVPKNCAEVLLMCGGKSSGVYTIKPDIQDAFEVYCDQKTSGGGWTVFQKRQDGSVDFFRGWADYKAGFGNLRGEFWLGLTKIYRLTHQAKNRLRVDLMDTTGKTAYADYDYFAVSAERAKYKLALGTYSGTAGDSLGYHRGSPFSTKDRDNDANSGNCAISYNGAWWYKSCHNSNLNGLYLHGAHSSGAVGVNWYHWKGNNYSAKRAEMKIRPVDFVPQ